jgi:hypothetical protein
MLKAFHHHAAQEDPSRWVTIFEIVSASTILLLVILVLMLVLTYQSG